MTWQFFQSLAKWFGVGVGGYFAILFLINSQWIWGAMALLATLGYVLIMNRPLKQKKLTIKSESPAVDIDWQDWQKIDVFDETVEWQKSLTYEVIDLCEQIVRMLGDSSVYNDDTIRIFRQSGGGDGEYSSLSVELLPKNTRVLYVTENSSLNYKIRRTLNHIHTFRVGSWLDYIKALEAEFEPVQQARREKAEQRGRDEHLRNFGRVD